MPHRLQNRQNNMPLFVYAPFLWKFELKATLVWRIHSFLELLPNALHFSQGPSIVVGTY